MHANLKAQQRHGRRAGCIGLNPKPETLNPYRRTIDTGIEEVYRHGARLLAHGSRARTRRHMERREREREGEMHLLAHAHTSQVAR
jgi:hypothetical protein